MAAKKKDEPGTDLIVAGEDSPYAVLQMEHGELAELIEEHLGGDTITVRDLDRVKVPAGGSTTWEVPSLDGEESTKVLSGVIVAKATRRAYWSKPFDGSDEPPECSSEDGTIGKAHEEANLGWDVQECIDCPFNEFGSAKDGVSKACKETRQLFLLTEDSLIPLVVTIPPGSLANVKAYTMRLLRARLKTTDVVTHLALEKAKSQGGIDYAKVTLTAGDRLDKAAAAQIREYAKALTPAFQRAAEVERADVETA